MLEISEWSPLHIRLITEVANAKLAAFIDVADYTGELVQLGVLDKAAAADLLQEVAVYNQLTFEYGHDRIQKIMAKSFKVAA